MTRSKILRAVDAVLRNLRFREVRSDAPPRELRAECEMLEDRRLLNGITHVGTPPYFSVYLSYNFMYSWEDCCGQSHGIQAEFSGAMVNTPTSFMLSAGGSASMWPVRYLDGQAMVSATDIDSDGFGQMWGQNRVWSDPAGSLHDSTINGNHWTVMQIPQLVKLPSNSDLAVVDDGQGQRWFAPGAGGTYTQVGVATGNTLRYDSATGDYVATDNAGNQEWFTAPSSSAAGQMVQYLDAAGHQTNYIYTLSSASVEQLTEIQRISGSNVESWHYFYTGPSSTDKISGVVLRRSTNGTSGPWTDIRETDYTYGTSSSSFANVGDLQSVITRNGASTDVTSVPGNGAQLGETYYRYYTSADAGSIGYVGGLRYVFNPEAYATAKAAGYDPATSSDDAHLRLYADDYFEYGNAAIPASNHMVVKEIAHDAGCSCTTDNGQATIYYDYMGNPSYPGDGYNNWLMRTIVNTPDGNADIVYTNYAAQDVFDAQLELQPSIAVSGVSLDSGTNWKYSVTGGNYAVGQSVLITGSDKSADNGLFTVTSVGSGYFEVSNAQGVASTHAATAQAVSRQWLTAKHYDASGNLLWTANPSAVTGFSESNADLVGYNASTNTATYVRTSSGLIQANDYYSVGWAISGNAGIAANSSTISGTVAAHDGTQAAFLKDTTGSVSQTITTSGSATYTLNFWGAYNTSSGTAPTLQVLLDGTSVGSYTLTGTYTQHSPTLSISTAGTHTITFQTTAGTGTALIDAASLTGTGAPALSDPSFESPTLASGTFVNDPLGMTATATVAGGVNGLIEDTKVQQGLSSAATSYVQQQYAYISQGGGTSGQSTPSGITYLPGTITVQGKTDGSDPRTTSYAYTFASGTTRVQQETITAPPITSTQDGPASSNTDTAHADTQTIVYDSYGRPIWTKDGDGFLTYTQYDDPTGAVVKRIDDVNTSDSSDFSNLPSGWTTPSGGGLELITSYVVDGLGRPTKITTPAGNVTCIVYNDANHETRTYVGWNSTTHTATGPIEIEREYYPTTSPAEPTLYTETIASSATPTYDSTTNLPTGQETIDQTNIQRLSRTLFNGGGEVDETDNYFSLSGVTYSAGTLYLGTSSNNTASGNYHATLFGYDDMGRQNMIKMPTGTIYRTVYDVLGNVTSRWVGTTDTTSDGNDWTPLNNSGNMVMVEEDGYDVGTTPSAPTVSQQTGGTITGNDFSIRVTYVSSGGVETPASMATVFALANNHELVVTSPGSLSGMTGYNVYVGVNGAAETKQNATPISIGTNWTEPSTGLVAGSIVPLSGVGDGVLNAVTQIPGAADPDRVTQNLYDWRDRLVAVKQGVQASEDTTTHRPIFYYALDNQGEVTGTYRYDGDQVSLSDFANGQPSGDAGKLRAQTLTTYDDQGRVYETQVFSVDPMLGTVSTNALTGKTWYNHRGNVIKTLSPGGLVQKYVYDGAGRQTTAYTSDGGGDSTWSDAGSVSGDIVVSQVETQYDGDGNPIFTTDRERFHDDLSTATGALGSPSSGVAARVYYMGDYYDAADRLTDSVNFGTNSGTTLSSRPAIGSLPSGSLHTIYGYAGDNVQVVTISGNPTGGSFTLTFGSQTTSPITYPASAASVQSALQSLSSIGSGNVTVYTSSTGVYLIRFTGTLGGKSESALTANGSALTGGTSPSASVSLSNLGGDAGVRQVTTDPRGIVSKMDVDILGRTTRTVDGHTSATPASIDQVTEYTYDGDNHVLTQNAIVGTNHQTTQYIYGYAGSGKYGLNSNDILVKLELPDPTTGDPSGSTSNDQSFSYDDLAETMKTVSDENGAIRALLYDVLGRVTSDGFAAIGSGEDGTVRSIGYSYDTNGQLSTASNYSGYQNTGTLLTQVEEVYNGLGQLVGEYQSHSGAVTTLTPEVQYEYLGLSGATSDGRATDMIYPNARKLDYTYNTGLDSNISRISALTDDAGDGAGNIESYSYLGLDTIVQRNRPDGVNLSYAKLSGESNGSAGDEYTGLDEFGRVTDQRWTTSGGTNVERYQYGYNADSDLMFKNNLSTGTNAGNFGEVYHTSVSGGDYDALNRITAFRRGILSPTHDAVTPSGTAGIDLTWTLDAAGNWSSVSTNSTPQSRSVNARNEYTAVGSTTPTYDNNGNLTKDENGQQYVYDAWNRLKQVQNSSGTVLVTYSYDAFGRRIVEGVNGGTTTDIYFDTSDHDIEERQGSTVTRQYVWGLGAPDQLVLRDDNLAGTHSYGKTSGGLTQRIFVQQDVNQNVTGLVSTTGTVLERFAYDPYGTKYVEDTNWSPVSDTYQWLYGFQAGRQDPTSGLLHFGTPGRDYSTSLGRWTEPDPAGYIQGANLYQTDVSAPTDRIDPSGLIARPGASPNGHWEWQEVQTANGGTYRQRVWIPDRVPPGTMQLADSVVVRDPKTGEWVTINPWVPPRIPPSPPPPPVTPARRPPLSRGDFFAPSCKLDYALGDAIYKGLSWLEGQTGINGFYLFAGPQGNIGPVGGQAGVGFQWTIDDGYYWGPEAYGGIGDNAFLWGGGWLGYGQDTGLDTHPNTGNLGGFTGIGPVEVGWSSGTYYVGINIADFWNIGVTLNQAKANAAGAKAGSCARTAFEHWDYNGAIQILW